MGSTEHNFKTSGLYYLLKFLSALIATVLILIKWTYLKQQKWPHSQPTKKTKQNKKTWVKAQHTFHSERLNVLVFKLYSKWLCLLLSMTVSDCYFHISHYFYTQHVSSCHLNFAFIFSGTKHPASTFPHWITKKKKNELLEDYLTSIYFFQLESPLFFLLCHI